MAGSQIPQRLTMVAVSVLSVAVCLALAWWQWERYESASGTWQNLGYVLQWPLFGLFPAFVFLRMRKLRRQAALQELDTEQPAEEQEPVREPEPPKPASQPAEADPGADDGADDELVAYNRYLAELHARDQEGRP